MSKEIKVICLIHKEFEDLELWYPIYRLREEGITVHLVGEDANYTYIGKYGVPATSDFSLKGFDYKDYDALVVPGGWAPDKLRRHDEIIEMTKYMKDNNKPIAYICHGGWILASARVVDGVKLTSSPGIKHDMENAGGIWVDESVVVDSNIVSSRKPGDLPDFMREFIKLLK